MRGRSTLTMAPAPVCRPQPRGPRISKSASGTESGTLTTLRSVHRQCVANDDWPKKWCRTGPSARESAVLPSARWPRKLVPKKYWQ
jgi:hypothetical protein